MVNKARLIEKIAELVRDKKIDGITDLSDQSSREGMRICIELRRDVNPNVILNQLYKHTRCRIHLALLCWHWLATAKSNESPGGAELLPEASGRCSYEKNKI